MVSSDTDGDEYMWVGWTSLGRDRHDGRTRASHIRPIFGLDMRGAGQLIEARLRCPAGSKFRDLLVTGGSTGRLRRVWGVWF